MLDSLDSSQIDAIIKDIQFLLRREPFPLSDLNAFSCRNYRTEEEARNWLEEIKTVLENFDTSEAQSILSKYENLWTTDKGSYCILQDESIPPLFLEQKIVDKRSGDPVIIHEADHIYYTILMRMRQAGVDRPDSPYYRKGCIWGWLL